MRSVGNGHRSACPFFCSTSLAQASAIYLSRIDSSSSMTSGSSSRSMSSGIVIVPVWGVLVPAVCCYPIIALPFSAHVAGFVGGHFAAGGGPQEDDCVVFSSISSISGSLFWTARFITIGDRDGTLSEAIGIAWYALIRLWDCVCGFGSAFLAFLFMNASNFYTTSLTLSFTVATFLSTLDIMAASSRAFVVSVGGRFATISTSFLFSSCNSAIWDPIAFMRFNIAFDWDRAVGPARAAVSSSLRRF